MEDTNKLKDEVESAVSRAENLDALEAIRISELGKNGRITLLMKGLGQLGPAERRLVGKNLNELKNTNNNPVKCPKRYESLHIITRNIQGKAKPTSRKNLFDSAKDSLI